MVLSAWYKWYTNQSISTFFPSSSSLFCCPSKPDVSSCSLLRELKANHCIQLIAWQVSASALQIAEWMKSRSRCFGRFWVCVCVKHHPPRSNTNQNAIWICCCTLSIWAIGVCLPFQLPISNKKNVLKKKIVFDFCLWVLLKNTLPNSLKLYLSQ